MKNSTVLLSFFLVIASLKVSSQSELSIEDIDNDGDVTIEIIKKLSAKDELRNMLLGVNQSSGGFLRMISDDDLSFWTKNMRRLTIANNGQVGVGLSDPKASLHVGPGDIIAQTQLRIIGNLGLQEARLSFFSGDSRIGGLLSRGSNLILESENKGSIFLRSEDTDHLIARPDGNIIVPGLSGSGHRNLTVDQNGTLKAEETEDIHMMIPVTQFQAMFGLTINSLFGGIWTPPSFFQQNLTGLRVTPVFHHTRILIKTLRIDFIDNDNDNITFQVYPPGADPIIETSEGINGSITFQLDATIDQSLDEDLRIIILGAKNDNLFINGAKIVYQKL